MSGRGRRAATGAAATVALLLTAPIAAEATFPGANGSIAFTCGGQREPEGICVVRADGRGFRRLDRDVVAGSEARGGDSLPVWSPDGTEIAFARSLGQRPPNGFTIKEIFTMRADGSGRRRVTYLNAYATAPSWSPDGRRLAFETVNAVHVVDRSTGTVERLADGHEPAWSPDGRLIAFVSGRDRLCRAVSDVCVDAPQLYTMRPDGSEQTRLSLERTEFRGPSWSPDGSEVVVGCNNLVCAIPRQGGGLRRVRGAGERPAPARSPDGRLLAFTGGGYGPGGFAVRVAPSSSGSARTVRAGGDPDWQALARPPGRAGPSPELRVATRVRLPGRDRLSLPVACPLPRAATCRGTAVLYPAARPPRACTRPLHVAGGSFRTRRSRPVAVRLRLSGYGRRCLRAGLRRLRATVASPDLSQSVTRSVVVR